MTTLIFFFSLIRKEPATDVLLDLFYLNIYFIYSASE